jgi:inositol transporter-like SP family MFS transporter
MNSSVQPMAKRPSGVSHWKAAFLCAMASYLDAGALTGLGITLVLFADELKISQMDMGFMSGMMTFFFAGGALVGGWLGDRFGRKATFRFSLLLFLMGCACFAVAQNHAMLYAGIVLTGFAVGADLPVALALAAESSPPHVRGRVVTLSGILWMVGMMSTALITIVCGGLGSWGGRIIFIHLFIVGAIVLVWRSGLPESKEWLDARATKIATEDEVRWSDARELLAPANLKAVVYLGMFLLFMNIPLNTIGQFGALLWGQILHLPMESYAKFQLAMMVPSLLFFALFMKIVDGPRRTLWTTLGAISFVIGFTLPIIFGLSFNILLIALMFQFFGAMISGEPLFRVLTNEIMPVMIRSTSQGLSMALARCGAASFALITPLLLDDGARPLFWALLGCSIVSGCILVFLIPKLPRQAAVVKPVAQEVTQ